MTGFSVVSEGAESTSLGMKGFAGRVRANPCKRPDSRFRVLRQRLPSGALKDARAGSERVQPKQARFEDSLIVELIEPRRGRGIVIDRDSTSFATGSAVEERSNVLPFGAEGRPRG